jgi:hypothetical protein
MLEEISASGDDGRKAIEAAKKGEPMGRQATEFCMRVMEFLNPAEEQAGMFNESGY